MKTGSYLFIYVLPLPLVHLMKNLNQLTNTSDSIQPDGEHVYCQSFGPF